MNYYHMLFTEISQKSKVKVSLDLIDNVNIR